MVERRSFRFEARLKASAMVSGEGRSVGQTRPSAKTCGCCNRYFSTGQDFSGQPLSLFGQLLRSAEVTHFSRQSRRTPGLFRLSSLMEIAMREHSSYGDHIVPVKDVQKFTNIGIVNEGIRFERFRDCMASRTVDLNRSKSKAKLMKRNNSKNQKHHIHVRKQEPQRLCLTEFQDLLYRFFSYFWRGTPHSDTQEWPPANKSWMNLQRTPQEYPPSN